jgi:anti-sigma B factor antagonist
MTGSELSVTVEAGSKWTTLVVQGEIDVLTSPQLQTSLDEALLIGSDIVVDLTAVSFMDSTGLGVLVRSLKKAQDNASDLRLVVKRSSVLRVLEITGLDEVFSIHPSIELATQAN